MGIDLSTTYLGLQLANPLVAGACPLTGDLSKLKRFEDAGGAAAVLPSLFEEQTELQGFEEGHDYHDGPGFPQSENGDSHKSGLDLYIEHVEQAKKSLSIPIIGSLNGTSRGSWIRFAHLLEAAGADAIELNIFYVPTDAMLTTQEVEDRYVDIVAAARETVSIPIAVKIGPYFSALPYMCKRLIAAGANGLVLFNRFLEPEIDLGELEVEPYQELSHQSELRLPLRWIAILRDELTTSIAATSGIHDAHDMIRAILAGADVTMLATVLMRYGPEHAKVLLKSFDSWLNDNDFPSVEATKGFLSRRNAADKTVFERANYMRIMSRFDRKFA